MKNLTGKDIIEILVFIVAVAGVIAAFVYGAIHGVKRVRKDTRLREQSESDNAQRAADARVAPFREAAEGWEKAYRTQVIRVGELEKQVEELKRNRDEVKREHDQVVRLNLQLQGEIDGLQQRVAVLEAGLR